MTDITKLDLYDLLKITPDVTEKEIKKAYRKKALECHPDKNPDDARAAELFHQLSKALEILTDASARAAYDKVLKSRKAAEIRHKQLDSKRKKFKEELEKREKDAQTDTLDKRDAVERLHAEIERLRREGSRQVEEEQQLLREQLAKQAEELEKTLPRLKVKWKVSKGESGDGYDEDSLTKIFSKYGEIATIVISSSRKGSALVEFCSTEAAAAAVLHEKGIKSTPLKVTWLHGKPTNARTGDNAEFTGYKPSSEPMGSNTSITERDYESLVLMKMRQAEERKKLIEQMKDEDD